MAAGRILLQFEVDEVAHTERLTRLGYLHPNVADEPEAINRATAEMYAATYLNEEG